MAYHLKALRRWLVAPVISGLALVAMLLLDLPLTPAAAASEEAASTALPASTAAVSAPAARQSASAARTLLPIHRWLRPGEYAWDGERASAGPVSVVVDLRARTLSVYRSGVEIGRSFITYGSDEKPTPLGRFKILEKDADHVSNLYGADMPYMLRLTNDGIAIHGGEIEDDIATRGCVGIPKEFAQMLFRATRVGGEVLIMKGPPQGEGYTAYAALPRT